METLTLIAVFFGIYIYFLVVVSKESIENRVNTVRRWKLGEYIGRGGPQVLVTATSLAWSKRRGPDRELHRVKDHLHIHTYILFKRGRCSSRHDIEYRTLVQHLFLETQRRFNFANCRG